MDVVSILSVSLVAGAGFGAGWFLVEVLKDAFNQILSWMKRR